MTRPLHRLFGYLSNMNSSNNNSNISNNDINTDSTSGIQAIPANKLDIKDVHDISDINNLSVAQLKIILTRNCVSYKGIIEKEILRQKVGQLWIEYNERKSRRTGQQEVNRSQDDSCDIDENQLCKICMEREIDCVLLECGHYFVCVTCGRKLADCPICRQNVTRCVRTFKG